MGALLLDLEGREWGALQAARHEGALQGVRSVVVRGEFKPLFEGQVLHWVKELNARALLHLEEWAHWDALGLHLVHAQRDPAHADGSQRLLTWWRAAGTG